MATHSGSDNSKMPEFELVIPVANDQSPFPYFSEPRVVGCYSLDANRSFIDGPEHLKYCQFFKGKRQVNFNLDAACTVASVETLAVPQTQERSSENSELKHLRRWINLHRDTFLERRPNFVLRRGVLLKILHTPYEEKEDWILAAMYKKGTIYLRKILKFATTEEWAKYNSNARHKRLTSWGHNFEDFLLSDNPSEKPNPDNPRKGECNLVFRAKLKHREILYAAELDGIWSSGNGPNKYTLTPEVLDSNKFVELKTTRDMPDGRMTYYFRNSILRKWWCQAFLGRVMEILVGFRTDDGIVRKLDTMQVNQLPRLARDWSPTVCFNFLDRFLHEVEKIVSQNQEFVYVFKYDPRDQKTRDVYIRVIAEKNSDKLLPDLL